MQWLQLLAPLSARVHNFRHDLSYLPPNPKMSQLPMISGARENGMVRIPSRSLWISITSLLRRNPRYTRLVTGTNNHVDSNTFATTVFELTHFVISRN